MGSAASAKEDVVPWKRWLKQQHMVVSIVMGVPHNGWFIMERPLKMDENWGYPENSGNPDMVAILAKIRNHTVDGCEILHQLIGGFSHYL